MIEPVVRPLAYRSPTVVIGDYRCRHGRSGRLPEEHSGDHSIAFVRRGVFVKHVAGDELVADAGRVVFFRRGEPYRVSHPGCSGDSCTTLRFPADVLAEVLAAVDPRAADDHDRPFVFTHGPTSAEACLVHAALARSARGAAGPDGRVDDLALRFLEVLLRDSYAARGERPRARRESTTAAHRDLAHAAKVALAERGGECLGLADLARRVHSSPFHLSRVFRAVEGETLARYLARLRVRRALDLVTEGADDLTAVALRAGYFDHSHLTNAFRREFGVAPSAVRRGGWGSGGRELGPDAK